MTSFSEQRQPDPTRFNQSNAEEVRAWVESYDNIVIVAISYNHARVAQREMERLIDAPVRGRKVAIATEPEDLRGLRSNGDIGAIIVSSTSYPWEVAEELKKRGWKDGREDLKVWYT